MIEQKIILIKKLIATITLLISVLQGHHDTKLGSVKLGAITPVPDLSIGTQTYSFPYTGTTIGQTLIIHTTQENYTISQPIGINGKPGADNAAIVVAVTNNSLSQNVRLLLTTSGKLTAGLFPFAVISPTAPPNYLGYSQITSAARSLLSPLRPVVGTLFTQSESQFINAGETKYFKISLTSTLKQGESEDFYLEAFGSLGAYGFSF